MLVLFLWGCGLQSAETSSTTDHKSIIMHLKKTSPLTDNNFSFRYNNRELIANQRTVQEIKYSVRNFSRITKNVERFLQNDNSLLPELTENKITVDEYSTPYILSLLFREKYKQAQTNALVLLEKTPDHYGALLLLGLLSMYDRKNFPYLERAFVMNPLKTLYFFDWHFNYITFSPQQDWDFVDAFFQMLTAHRTLLVNLKMPPNLFPRLSGAFFLKYEMKQKNGQNEPKYRISSEMYEMIELIRKNFQYAPKKVIKPD